MICLTGDVHQSSFDNDEQSYLDGSELQIALEYQNIVNKYGLKNTIFVTGRAMKEEPAIAKKLASFDNLELGGHTWAAFRPLTLHRLFGGFLGDTYGPKWFQSWDVQRTCRWIQSIACRPVQSWRTHAYLSSEITREVLANAGIKLISDTVTPKARKPLKTDIDGLISLPINTLPDHEHIYHGSRNKEFVEAENNSWSDEFTSESFEIDKWLKQVQNQVRAIERDGGVATILVHPSCMAISDGYNAFERLCSWIEKEDFETGRCIDVLDY